MDVNLEEKLCQNSINYKRSLIRIIDKYSKLQYQDGGVDVDLCNTEPRTLVHYMEQSKTNLNELESKSLTDLRDNSLRAQDITTYSQLDFTHQDGGADETCVSSVSSNQSSFADDGMARSDTMHLTTSSLDESVGNLSEIEFQPEDQDEDLEMSLRSHGSSLVELYPRMISQIERAWHRQHVSDAASSVLRRYRRWRRQPNRSNLNNTFIVPPRNPIKNSPVKIPFMGTVPQSPVRLVTHAQAWHAQQESPGRMRGLLRTKQHKPVLVMDLSDSPETSNPKEISLNETFDVSELTEQPFTYTVTPSQPFYPTAKASFDMSFRAKRRSLAAHSPQTTAVEDRPDIYSSPVRQSPRKARMMADFSGSPHAFCRSPRAHSVESFSREPMRPRSLSTSLSSPSQKPVVPLRMLDPQNSRHSFQYPLPSPQSATAAEGHHRLRLHFSFDSSLPSMQVSSSPKKVDEEFVKLYHSYFCQRKSSLFDRPPCRFCARGAEASRGHSSSALAALALSPHRSLLRKRHRELNWESHPESKRFRDEYCASSPGSERHGNEMLRRRLSTSGYEHSYDSLSHSPSKHNTFQRFSTQQRSADAHQGAWMSQGYYVPAAQFSGLGGSFEGKIANGYSPRKCW